MTKQLEKSIDLATFSPTKYKTTCCDTILFPLYPGEFIRCKCGKVGVDQTEHYQRVIGDINNLEGYKE